MKYIADLLIVGSLGVGDWCLRILKGSITVSIFIIYICESAMRHEAVDSTNILYISSLMTFEVLGFKDRATICVYSIP